MRGAALVPARHARAGLPTQVRDTVLGIEQIVPTSDTNKQYYAQNMDKQLALTDGTESAVVRAVCQIRSRCQHAQGKMKVTDAVLKLARTDPYYKRNRAHLCSFWVKGECKRGAECPYRCAPPLHDWTDSHSSQPRDAVRSQRPAGQAKHQGPLPRRERPRGGEDHAQSQECVRCMTQRRR